MRTPHTEYPTYDSVVEDTNKLNVSAGVAHVCSIHDSDAYRYQTSPSNYTQIERMAYSLIGRNMIEAGNLKEKAEAITNIYHFMKQFKQGLLQPVTTPFVGNLVAVDTANSHSEIGMMSVVRLMEKVGISVKEVIDKTYLFKDDMWFKEKDGEIVTAILYEEYIRNLDKFDPQEPIVVCTFNNFPTRLMFFGRHKDIMNSLVKGTNNIYPQTLANAPQMIQHIIEHVDGSIV